MSKLLLTFLFVTVTAAFASTIQFTGLPDNFAYGTYNGFATATIDGVPLQQLICDDYDHTTYVPSGPMDFSSSTLSGSNPLATVRFVEPGNTAKTVAKYEEAAILLDWMRQSQGTLLDLTADYQYALWELFTPTVKAPNATAQTLLNDAATRVKAQNAADQTIYAELMIYTPKAAYASNQEFLQLVTAPTRGATTLETATTNPTPEPPAELLVGLGLVAIGWAARRGTAGTRLGVQFRA